MTTRSNSRRQVERVLSERRKDLDLRKNDHLDYLRRGIPEHVLAIINSCSTSDSKRVQVSVNSSILSLNECFPRAGVG